MNKKPEISVVIPVYRAESILQELVKQLNTALNSLKVSYEIVLVDDRSPDDSWVKMKELSSQYNVVKSYRLSRNFGQHPAIMAGLHQSKGNWVVVMDCDLQDQPKEIIKLYKKALEGYDVVLAKREHRKDGFAKRLSSKIFAKVYGYLTDTKFNNEIANFGIYNKKVILKILSIGDYIKSFPLFNSWVGFNQTAITIEHGLRYDGKSTYTLKKLLNLAFNTIISFSNKPLKIFVKFGLVISLLSFLAGIYNIYLSIMGKITVLGYSSIIISIWFLSGVIITVVGITGIYIGKIFDQTKNRPSFIIDEIVENEV